MKHGKAVKVTAFLDLPAYDDVVSRPVPLPAQFLEIVTQRSWFAP